MEMRKAKATVLAPPQVIVQSSMITVLLEQLHGAKSIDNRESMSNAPEHEVTVSTSESAVEVRYVGPPSNFPLLLATNVPDSSSFRSRGYSPLARERSSERRRCRLALNRPPRSAGW